MPDTGGNGATQTTILIAIGVDAICGITGASISSSPQSATLILGFCGMIATQLFSMLQQARAAKKVEEATVAVQHKVEEVAVKAEEVKASLKQTTADKNARLDAIEKTGLATHTLVNNNMGLQLKLTEIATKELADVTGKPEHIRAAAEASRLYKDHMTKQAVVDKQ